MSGGSKFDNEKPRLDLVSPIAITELAKVLSHGAFKYGLHNWREGLSYSRLVAAALRHILSFLSGESKDPETGLSHIAHAMANCMFLLEFEATQPHLDDRYKPTSDTTTCPSSIVNSSKP